MTRITEGRRAIAVCAKIRKSFEHITGEEMLFLSVVTSAIKEAYGVPADIDRVSRNRALRYIAGDMPHAQLIGLDPQWIKDLIKRAGLILPADKRC